MSARPLDLRHRLRAELTAAMKRKDRSSAALFRSTLAALENAEAVPPESVGAAAIEDSPIGAGAGDTERRTLTPGEEQAVVQAEIDERHAAAATLAQVDQDTASRLRGEARLLAELLVGS